MIIDTRANCIAKKNGQKKTPEIVKIGPQRKSTKNMEISLPSIVCKGCDTETLWIRGQAPCHPFPWKDRGVY